MVNNPTGWVLGAAPEHLMVWQFLHPDMTIEHLGLLPGMLDPADPDSAKVQFDKSYQHGGGWCHQPGFVLSDDNTMTYPGDPPFGPLAMTYLRDELIIFYPCSYVAVIQPDRTFEMCRMD